MQRIQQPDQRPGRVHLEPFFCKIGSVGTLVVIVLEELAHHQEIEREGVLTMIVVVEIGVAVFMTAPIDDGAMNGPHEKMHRQQQEEPPVCGENDIECGVTEAENDAGRPGIAETIERRPGRIAVAEGRLGLFFVFQVIEIDVLGLYHQAPDVLDEMRRVGVLFGIAVGMVHPVQDGIGARVKERRSLRNEGETIKKAFPALGHFEHLMGSVSVKEEGLRKKRHEPVTHEEQENCHRVGMMPSVKRGKSSPFFWFPPKIRYLYLGQRYLPSESLAIAYHHWSPGLPGLVHSERCTFDP